MEEEKLHKVLESLSIADDGAAAVTQLAQTLQACVELKDPVQQVKLVQKAGSQLRCLSEEQQGGALLLLGSCLHTLGLLYVSLTPKNPLRPAIARALGSVPDWLEQHAVDSLTGCLSDCLSNPASEQHPYVVDIISSCLDGFALGERCITRLLPEVLQFLSVGLKCYLHQNSDLAGRHIVQAQLMHSCQGAVKTSMLVIQRAQEAISAALLAKQSGCMLEEMLSSLMDSYIHILTDDEFVQVVQSTAGMALVALIRTVMGSGDEVASVACCLLRGSPQGLDVAPLWLRLRCQTLCTRGRRAQVSLYLCHGALAMLSVKSALCGPHLEDLLLLVPSTLLGLDVSVKESSTAMVVARMLNLWSSATLDCLQGATQPCPSHLVDSLCGGSALQHRLLDHIYSYWEHPLDGVRHQTLSLFRNLLLLHQHISAPSGQPTGDPYMRELTQGLLQLEWHIRGKYGSLGCLAELHGAGYLLEVCPQLPQQLLGLMGDQTLASYAADLLEKLFVSHRAQLAGQEGWEQLWHQTWVCPLLQVLCGANLEQTTYILDYFLPRLLRCSPSSLAHMVQSLQEMPPSSLATGAAGSRGALGALMTCLRAARAQGVLPGFDQAVQDGLVPLPLLRLALVHKHHQVRMDALGLFCECLRTTEVLTQQELDLIRHFLPHNLNSQSPSVRQQTVSLMKKLLCRMKDSSVLLQKRRQQEENNQEQHSIGLYREFLHWMCVMLLEVLLPGASFSKCLLSLHLLCLLGHVFSFGSEADSLALGGAVTSAHAQNVLYCVGSDFMEVKQLATTLIRQLPASTVGLQDDTRMRCVLHAALDLSTSTKPFDSVTAAHLLVLLLPLPHLRRALLHCAQEENLDHFQLPPQPLEEAGILEANALAVVQLLLLSLQLEVTRAESSLLQAAASCPMYGRAHCITTVLQQLHTETFTQMEQWRSLVSALISVCYRMSQVVSPVVQSSSPEGLIPMDSDSGTSAGLQKILQEIQPRDTNDFFTSAKELETSAAPADTLSPSAAGDESYRVTAQMVLVCCWRSMKEVANLLGQLCHSLPLHDTQDDSHTHPGLITRAQVEGVGLYFRQQLLQSRHRGTFELAYVGFVRFTDMLCRSELLSLQQLPARWLCEVLEEVKCSDPSSKLCATRRSAGIPFYIQALLSSEPKSSSCSLLKMTMRELMALAGPAAAGRDSNTSSVPQVHALNILRALYRDTRLGENIIPFIADGLQAAVLGFTSPVWAVRNSSTLLFSTLITRIFGVKRGKDEHSKKNRMTGREFFTRFPVLYSFLLNQLEEAAATVESDSGQVKLHPSLFLLLLVLSRLYPSPMDGSSSPLGLAPFMPFIIRCSRSAVYRTREMAARALVPFVLLTQVPSTVCTLLQELPAHPGTHIQHNHIHGTLLQVLFLLQSYQSDSPRPLAAGSGISEVLCQRAWLASRQNQCLVTRGAFLDVLLCLCGTRTSLLHDSEVVVLREKALSILMTSELLSDSEASQAEQRVPGSSQYQLSLARLALTASVELSELWQGGGAQLAGDLLRRLLGSHQYEVRELALDGVLRVLQQLDLQQQDLLQQDLQQQDLQHFLHQQDTQQQNLQQKGYRGPRRPDWLDETTLSDLTSASLQETHPQCLAKVLTVLSTFNSVSELQWKDGSKRLSQEEVLLHLLALAERAAHSVEISCAVLTLVSQLVVHMVNCHPEGSSSAAAALAQWAALVCSRCTDDQPLEVKVAAAKALVSCADGVLTNPHLPLGLTSTVSLWRSLFTLLQDEDQDVRTAAADFLLVQSPAAGDAAHCSSDAARVSVCPPVALHSGLELLCGLLKQWRQVPAGVLMLTTWLLGEEESADQASSVEFSSVAEEDFLFEKGNLNLWAEPLQWAKMLHGRLCDLIGASGLLSGSYEAQLVQALSQRARVQELNSQQALDKLPTLPQFSCTMEHARLTLQQQRASLALNVLHRLG